MRNFKNMLIMIISLISSSIFAADYGVIKPKAGFEFVAAVHKNNGNATQRVVSPYNNVFGFDTKATVSIEYINVVDNWFEYGLKIGLQTTSENSRKIASSIFLISDYGKLELGSDKSAYAKMKITSNSIACGTGGGWDSWTTLAPDSTKLSYIAGFANFVDAKTRLKPHSEYSRKISYYTPKMAGFEPGISLIPDSTNVGYSAHDSAALHELAKPRKHYFVVKDAIALGGMYETKFASQDQGKFKISTVFEYGKIKAFNNPDKTQAAIKFSNISTYTVGAELHYQDYAIAAAYMNHMRSLTATELDTTSKDSHVIGLGGRYKFDPFAVSLNYTQSFHKRNSARAVTLATDYKIRDGLVSYLEGTHYRAAGNYLQNDQLTKTHLKGNLLLWGLKLEI